MSSRTPVFAAVTLLVSCLASPAAWAQATNLEAGKTPSQLFAGACNACHKSPRGLLKTVAPGSLPGFLREHYTTSGDMASELATYLISNGASDKSKQGADKPGQGGNDQADRQGGRKNRNAPNQEAARPDDAPPSAEGGRPSRRRQANPAEQPEEGKPVTNTPAQATTERGPDGRKLSSRQRGKPGKQPGADEPSMANEPARSESAKGEPAKVESGADEKASGEIKQEMGNASAKPDAMKSDDEVKSFEPAKSEAAKVEAPKDNVRRDPAPAATPAPPAAASVIAPPPASAPTATSNGSPEPAAPRPAAAESSAVTASVPPPPPPPPGAGPPAAPMSQ
jgi:hypothetical protein